MTDRNSQEPARPRSEPEIIPPDHSRHGDRVGIWVAVDDNDGPRRVYVARPGPFAIIMALAVLALIAMVMLILLLSVAVIWIPVVIVLVVTFLATITLRRYWWRFRAWLGR